MPGSWELKKANQVVVGILHTDATTMAWSFGLRGLALPGREDLRMFWPFAPIAGQPFDMGRNSICAHMLSLKMPEWVFMLDSDVVPPKDAISKLLSHKHPFVSGLYFRRSPPHGVPVAMRFAETTDERGNKVRVPQWLSDYVPGSTVEVDLVGSGCLLIHKTVLERVAPWPGREEKRWFDWRVDARGKKGFGEGDCLSEDYCLCRAVKEQLGISPLLVTSVVCKHIGLAEAHQGGMSPSGVGPT